MTAAGAVHAALAVGLGLASVSREPAATPPTAACESRDLGGGTFFVRGRVAIHAPPEHAYAVIADFDHVAEFVSTIDSSHVVGRDRGDVLVRQVGTARYLLRHTVAMVLRFHPAPPERLRFEIVRGDFEIYYGSWSVDAAADGTRLQYEVTLRPPTFLPQFLVRPLAERILCRTLSEVRDEVERREATAGGDDSSAAPRGRPR